MPSPTANDPLVLVRGALLNEGRLVLEQPNPNCCLVCGGPNVSWNPLIPVLHAHQGSAPLASSGRLPRGARQAPSPEGRGAAHELAQRPARELSAMSMSAAPQIHG